MSLLSIGSDAKTVKGETLGVMTGVMYLSPADWIARNVPGFENAPNLCPKASADCTLACLFGAGRGQMANVIEARKRRTLAYLTNRPAFMAQLAEEVAALVKKAKRANMLPAVRLNGTSDILFEHRHPVNFEGDTYRSIFEAFPDLQFYDYTKVAVRLHRPIPANYHLTLSYSEASRSADYALAFAKGVNVARVFSNAVHPSKPARFWSLPDSFEGRPMLDGDATDLRFTDPQIGAWVGLKAKGSATSQVSEFVTPIDPIA